MMDSTGFFSLGEGELVVLIDNYDSFVFNLERYVRELGAATCVFRNDAVSVSNVLELQPEGVILSPGPCSPAEAGICEDLVRAACGRIPLLGVCLGHQALATGLGGRVIRSPEPMHGRTSLISHHAAGLFEHCEQPLRVTRYHSLIVDESSLPAELQVTARTSDGIIMGLEHRTHPLFGVQFHPESILTRCGHQLLANFLRRAGIETSRCMEREERVSPVTDADDFFQRRIGDGAFRPA